MADADEKEEKLPVPSDLKQPVLSDTKVVPDDNDVPKEELKVPSKTDAGGEEAKEAKDDSKKEGEPKKDEGPPGAASDADDWRIKTVKAKKNQFAINRLLLMFMDIKPEELTQDTIDDLKKIYCLLVHIHSIYTTLPP